MKRWSLYLLVAFTLSAVSGMVFAGEPEASPGADQAVVEQSADAVADGQMAEAAEHEEAEAEESGSNQKKIGLYVGIFLMILLMAVVVLKTPQG